MAAQNSTPRFRVKKHLQSNGDVSTYYHWDGRGRGVGTVNLGQDKEEALVHYANCEAGIYTSYKHSKVSKRTKTRITGSRRVLQGDDWENLPPWVRLMFFNAERRAKKAMRPFLITPDHLIALVESSNGACSISGIPFETKEKRSPFAPSLDRIDCKKGYEIGNIRLVCLILNVAMNTWGLGPVLHLAAALPHPLPHDKK